VALGLFRERGFDAVTVREITERADVGKGTFFHHFPAKEVVLLQHYRDVAARLLKFANRLEADTSRLWFRSLFQWMEELVADEDLLVDEVVRHVFSSPDLMQAENQVGGKLLDRYEEVIEDGVDRGELRSDLDRRLVARLVADLWSATLFGWIYQGRSFSIAAELERKLDVLFDGLRPGDGGDEDGPGAPSPEVGSKLESEAGTGGVRG